jgi:hypothetical protein
MTERHRELPVRTEVARVAEGRAVGDRFAGHLASEAILNGRRRFFLLDNKIYARMFFENLKALPILGWVARYSTLGWRTNNARNEGSCFIKSCYRLK